MSVDTFAVLAQPTRRRILDELRTSESSVGELVEALAVSQPTVSKHLKVLRAAGFVSSRTAAQQRIYRIEAGPFEAINEWLEPYRQL
jgi:Predicted transcriptional regulators